MRTSTGCWTCRLRRKRCDETRPICDGCASLNITCHFSNDRPAWMDGGAAQQAKSLELKQQIKTTAMRHRKGRPALQDGEGPTTSDTSAVERARATLPTRPKDGLHGNADHDANLTNAQDQPQTDHDLWVLINPRSKAQDDARHYDSAMNISHSDAILISFYLDTLFPFLFPFYHPSALSGGKSWILELMGSDLLRGTILCQSGYFFSLARHQFAGQGNWDAVLKRTAEAFHMLRGSVQIILDDGISRHWNCAVRVISSVIQVHRFEISILSFANWRKHLEAAAALFLELEGNADAMEESGPGLGFGSMHIGESWFSLDGITGNQVPSAERAALQFSSSLLVLDDVIGSLALQQEPKLYMHHSRLLESHDEQHSLDLEAVLGLQNWVVVQLGLIAALDAWRQRNSLAGTLDVMALVSRATPINERLASGINQLGHQARQPPNKVDEPAAIFAASAHHSPHGAAKQTLLLSQVWAHAAMIYLKVVVSGWQPSNDDVCHHIDSVIHLLTTKEWSPSSLRSMAWPFCVTGCVASPEQEDIFRSMVTKLQPSSIFGSVHKALELMENVWKQRDSRSLRADNSAQCFQVGEDIVLLV